MENGSLYGLTIIFWNVVVVQAQYSTGWAVENYPNPLIDVNKCGRNGKQSYVCDPDGILTTKEGKTNAR